MPADPKGATPRPDMAIVKIIDALERGEILRRSIVDDVITDITVMVKKAWSHADLVAALKERTENACVLCPLGEFDVAHTDGCDKAREALRKAGER